MLYPLLNNASVLPSVHYPPSHPPLEKLQNNHRFTVRLQKTSGHLQKCSLFFSGLLHKQLEAFGIFGRLGNFFVFENLWGKFGKPRVMYFDVIETLKKVLCKVIGIFT